LVEYLNLGGATAGTEAPYGPTYGEFRGAFGTVVRKSARPYRDERLRGRVSVDPKKGCVAEGLKPVL
jgi:hypothetical protein